DKCRDTDESLRSRSPDHVATHATNFRGKARTRTANGRLKQVRPSKQAGPPLRKHESSRNARAISDLLETEAGFPSVRQREHDRVARQPRGRFFGLYCCNFFPWYRREVYAMSNIRKDVSRQSDYVV
ncbi:hypothetical protein X777_04900, partial [Ooceraea biroi]